jgi:hypothetical protein
MRLRYLLAALVVAGVLAPAPGQENNTLLRQQEKLQTVAMQKVETSIKEAVSDAQRLSAAGSNARASERLRAALRLLDDPILPKKQTDEWRAQLTAAMRQAEAGKKPVVTAPGSNPLKEAEIARVQVLIETDKEVRRGVDTVAALMRAGDTAQAKKEVEALGKKHPDHPTVLVLPNLVAKTMSLDEVKAVHAKQIENIRLALLDLQKTATMAKFDYELPADWKEITERRKIKMAPKLVAVLTALRVPVDIDKTNAPLSEVLKGLQEAMRQPIVLDKATMQEAGVDQSTPTTVSPGTPVQARTALKMALGAHGLTYVIRDNTIVVVTREKATMMMETRVYYIGDLVAGTGPIPGGAVRLGYQADEEQTRRNVENIIKTIKESVDPASWKNGPGDGRGEISYNAPAKALIVKASAEVHGMMANTFNK